MMCGEMLIIPAGLCIAKLVLVYKVIFVLQRHVLLCNSVNFIWRVDFLPRPWLNPGVIYLAVAAGEYFFAKTAIVIKRSFFCSPWHRNSIRSNWTKFYFSLNWLAPEFAFCPQGEFEVNGRWSLSISRYDHSITTCSRPFHCVCCWGFAGLE
jgi:hypothetical protein